MGRVETVRSFMVVTPGVFWWWRQEPVWCWRTGRARPCDSYPTPVNAVLYRSISGTSAGSARRCSTRRPRARWARAASTTGRRASLDDGAQVVGVAAAGGVGLGEVGDLLGNRRE